MANNKWELAEQKLREISENVAWVVKKFSRQFTGEQVRAMGLERVEVVTLQRLEAGGGPLLGEEGEGQAGCVQR